MRRRDRLVLLLLVVASGAPLGAQSGGPERTAAADTVAAARGDIVRLRSSAPAGGPMVEGAVQWIRHDSLVVRVFPRSVTRAYASASVVDLRVRRHTAGARQRARRAAIIGAVLGGVAGYIAGDRLRCRRADPEPGVVDLSCDTGRSDYRVPFLAAGALLGAGGGWLTWSVVERPSWVPARLPDR